MHRPKIYLDSSVISRLAGNDNLSAYTIALWDEIKRGGYSAHISEASIKAVMDADEPTRSILVDYMEKIDYEIILDDESARQFAQKMIKDGVLTSDNINACLDIGRAVASGCDIIVSWDFINVANIKTISGVRFINLLDGGKDISIYPPCMIV